MKYNIYWVIQSACEVDDCKFINRCMASDWENSVSEGFAFASDVVEDGGTNWTKSMASGAFWPRLKKVQVMGETLPSRLQDTKYAFIKFKLRSKFH